MASSEPAVLRSPIVSKVDQTIQGFTSSWSLISRSNAEALGAAVLSFVVHEDHLLGVVTPCKRATVQKTPKNNKRVRFNQGGFLLNVVAKCQPTTIKSKSH